MRRFEVSEGIWLIPAARYKTEVDHEVPLSAAAQAVLASTPRIGPGDVVFTFNGVNPISGFSTLKKRFDAACGVTGWTLHNLRRTAKTLLQRAGVLPHISERCLRHVIRGVEGVYDHHAYRSEKLHAFEALAALVERIVRPPAHNVVSFNHSA